LGGYVFILAVENFGDRIRCDVSRFAGATERLELHCIVVILTRSIQKYRFFWMGSGEIDEFKGCLISLNISN
jgi:hypothetical protein